MSYNLQTLQCESSVEVGLFDLAWQQPPDDPRVVILECVSERVIIDHTNVNVGLDPEQPLGDPQVAVIARVSERKFVGRANVNVGLDPEQPLGDPQVAATACAPERRFVV